MRLSSRLKGRLRRIAKEYATRSGKPWVEEVGELYRNEQARRRQRCPKQ